MSESVLRPVGVASLLALPLISRSIARAPASQSITSCIALRSGIERLPSGRHNGELPHRLSVRESSRQLRGDQQPQPKLDEGVT